MQYLGLALYAEGKRDYHLLGPLLLRLCEDVCLDAHHVVDIGGVIGLDHPAEVDDRPRCERIARAATAAHPSWQVLFVHADADGDADSAIEERVMPGLALVRNAGLARAEGVPVVPVRMTDAWALADGDAIRSVLGTNLDDQRLGLPQRRALERVLDPKSALEATYLAVFGRRARNRVGAEGLLSALGEQTSLESLRELPSFQRVERDLRTALQQLQILP
jgi:hypothetical protein